MHVCRGAGVAIMRHRLFDRQSLGLFFCRGDHQVIIIAIMISKQMVWNSGGIAAPSEKSPENNVKAKQDQANRTTDKRNDKPDGQGLDVSTGSGQGCLDIFITRQSGQGYGPNVDEEGLSHLSSCVPRHAEI